MKGNIAMFISKRILIIIGIVGIIILGGLGFVTFQLLNQPSANASTGGATPTATPLVTAPRSTANRACATGTISSIDAQHSSFVVAETKGAKTVTIIADSQTTFHKHGASGVIFSSLVVGQHVRVTSQSACDTTTASFNAKAVTIVVTASSLTPTPGTSTSPTATP